MDQTTVEDQKYYELFDVLTFIGETDRVLNEITLTEKLVIENIAFTNTAVSIQAQAVLAELNNSGYIRFPEQLPPSANAMIIADEGNEEIRAISADENLQVFPNPSKGDITVHFSEPRQATCQLLDAMGREVREIEVTGEKSDYNVLMLPHGVYMVVIHYLDGEIETKRVIVE